MHDTSEKVSKLIARQNALKAITDALILSGYRSLDAQAQALGLCRSTAWTVIKRKHKLSRLHVDTTMKMLSNPGLPVQVRSAVEAYIRSVDLEETLAPLCRSRKNVQPRA